MIYVNSIASITNQKSFDNPGFSNALVPISEESSALLVPDYKKYIDSKLIRRMSNILRMSVACSQDCLEQDKVDPEAIIVGTGLGCLTDTKKFLENFILIEGMLPPTAFIQSTHNTIAGQVSLALKNHGYNMTHTQNSLSFEMALEDGLMSIEEGKDNVLVGAADEHIPYLDTFFNSVGIELPYKMTSGATFLNLSSSKEEYSKAEVKACKTYFGLSHSNELLDHINSFLNENELSIDVIDLAIYSVPFTSNDSFITGCKSLNISELSGLYLTNSAFGLHVAVDTIAMGEASFVLIVNNLVSENLGLVLLKSV